MKAAALRTWTRRGITLMLGACSLVLLTGCPWDDDDDIPSLPYQWEISWTGDNSDISPLTIVLEYGDLNEITNYMESFGDYTVSISRNGASITVEIWDYTGGSFGFYAIGTINSATSATGTYTGTSSSGGAISGNWSVTRL